MLKELIQNLKTRQASRSTSYKELVLRVARGEQLRIDEIEPSLTTANKSPDEFAEDVARATKRLRLQEEVRAGEEARQRRDKNIKKLHELDAKLLKAKAELESEYVPKAIPLNNQILSDTDAIRIGQSARSELRENPAKELVAAAKVLNDEFTECHNRLTALRKMISHNESAADDCEADGRECIHPKDVEPYTQRATRLRELVKSGRDEMAELDKRVSQIEKEQAALEEEMVFSI